MSRRWLQVTESVVTVLCWLPAIFEQDIDEDDVPEGYGDVMKEVVVFVAQFTDNLRFRYFWICS